MTYATVDALLKKPARTKDITITTMSDSDEPVELKIKLRAIGSREYDSMVAQFPPTVKQKKDGMAFNIDKFAPALMAKCFLDPPLSTEDAETLYNSPDWSAGEAGSLYVQCMRLCTEGLDIPTTAND